MAAASKRLLAARRVYIIHTHMRTTGLTERNGIISVKLNIKNSEIVKLVQAQVNGLWCGRVAVGERIEIRCSALTPPLSLSKYSFSPYI